MQSNDYDGSLNIDFDYLLYTWYAMALKTYFLNKTMSYIKGKLF